MFKKIIYNLFSRKVFRVGRGIAFCKLPVKLLDPLPMFRPELFNRRIAVFGEGFYPRKIFRPAVFFRFRGGFPAAAAPFAAGGGGLLPEFPGLLSPALFP